MWNVTEADRSEIPRPDVELSSDFSVCLIINYWSVHCLTLFLVSKIHLDEPSKPLPKTNIAEFFVLIWINYCLLYLPDKIILHCESDPASWKYCPSYCFWSKTRSNINILSETSFELCVRHTMFPDLVPLSAQPCCIVCYHSNNISLKTRQQLLCLSLALRSSNINEG